jgi:hypothetical protein
MTTRPIWTALLLLACDSPAPAGPIEQGHAKATAGVLFEIDGCKVYRFTDERYHYFARCQDRVSVLETQCRQQGKALICASEETETLNR